MKNSNSVQNLSDRFFSLKTLLTVSVAVVIPVFAVVLIIYLIARDQEAAENKD